MSVFFHRKFCKATLRLGVLLGRISRTEVVLGSLRRNVRCEKIFWEEMEMVVLCFL